VPSFDGMSPKLPEFVDHDVNSERAARYDAL